MHALSGCDTVSFPYGKGKISALKVLQNNDITGLQNLGEEDATQSDLLECVKNHFLVLYGQTRVNTMNEARYNFFRKRKKPLGLKNLPPTDQNLLFLLCMHTSKSLVESSK